MILFLKGLVDFFLRNRIKKIFCVVFVSFSFIEFEMVWFFSRRFTVFVGFKVCSRRFDYNFVGERIIEVGLKRL